MGGWPDYSNATALPGYSAGLSFCANWTSLPTGSFVGRVWFSYALLDEPMIMPEAQDLRYTPLILDVTKLNTQYDGVDWLIGVVQRARWFDIGDAAHRQTITSAKKKKKKLNQLFLNFWKKKWQAPEHHTLLL
jgi:hypothetical protein